MASDFPRSPVLLKGALAAGRPIATVRSRLNTHAQPQTPARVAMQGQLNALTAAGGVGPC
jgi:hypothetical protein